MGDLNDQLARDCTGTGNQSEAELDKQLEELKNQVLVISNQKEMLMSMVKQVYDNTDDAPTEEVAGNQPLTSISDAGPGYGKLLPDPSELLATDPWIAR